MPQQHKYLTASQIDRVGLILNASRFVLLVTFQFQFYKDGCTISLQVDITDPLTIRGGYT